MESLAKLSSEDKTIRYVVSHNGKDIFHYVELQPHHRHDTGLPYLETFKSEEEAKKKFGDKIKTETDFQNELKAREDEFDGSI